MAQRTSDVQSEHDAVVEASAASYANMRSRGYRVSTNPDGEHNQSVGSPPLYPDLILWLPERPGSSSGRAKVIEEIETAESVTDREANQWADYASLNVDAFYLVVPREKKADAAAIVRRKAIRGVTKIQGYWIANGLVHFD